MRLVALFAALFVTIILASSCGTADPPQEDSGSFETPNSGFEFVRYFSSRLEFSLDLPRDWGVQEGPRVIDFGSTDENQGHVRVSIDAIRDAEIDEEFFRLALFQTTGAFTSPEAVSVTQGVLDGQPSLIASYITRNVIINRIVYEKVIQITRDDKRYLIKFGVLEDQLKEVEDLFGHMLESFRFYVEGS